VSWCPAMSYANSPAAIGTLCASAPRAYTAKLVSSSSTAAETRYSPSIASITILLAGTIPTHCPYVPPLTAKYRLFGCQVGYHCLGAGSTLNVASAERSAGLAEDDPDERQSEPETTPPRVAACPVQMPNLNPGQRAKRERGRAKVECTQEKPLVNGIGRRDVHSLFGSVPGRGVTGSRS
jgi:hypothetical protein